MSTTDGIETEVTKNRTSVSIASTSIAIGSRSATALSTRQRYGRPLPFVERTAPALDAENSSLVYYYAYQLQFDVLSRVQVYLQISEVF